MKCLHCLCPCFFSGFDSIEIKKPLLETPAPVVYQPPIYNEEIENEKFTDSFQQVKSLTPEQNQINKKKSIIDDKFNSSRLLNETISIENKDNSSIFINNQIKIVLNDMISKVLNQEKINIELTKAFEDQLDRVATNLVEEIICTVEQEFILLTAEEENKKKAKAKEAQKRIDDQNRLKRRRRLSMEGDPFLLSSVLKYQRLKVLTSDSKLDISPSNIEHDTSDISNNSQSFDEKSYLISSQDDNYSAKSDNNLSLSTLNVPFYNVNEIDHYQRSGYLRKRSTGIINWRWKRRYFLLQDGILYWTKDKEKIAGHVSLDQLLESIQYLDPRTIKLVFSDKIRILQLVKEDPDQLMNEWFRDFQISLKFIELRNSEESDLIPYHITPSFLTALEELVDAESVAFQSLCNGGNFIRRKEKSSKSYFFFVSPDFQKFCWGSDRDDIRKALYISQFFQISRIKKTITFSFTNVHQKQSFEFELYTEKEAIKWESMFRLLVSKYGRKPPK